VTLALLAALVGCKAADALSTQEVVVHFAPHAPAAAHVEVQQTCALVPHVSPVPMPPHANSVQALTDVHFLVKPGTDANVKALYTCLAKFPGVVLGYDAPDM
jgi:hypothetical protein